MQFDFDYEPGKIHRKIVAFNWSGCVLSRKIPNPKIDVLLRTSGLLSERAVTA